VPRALRHRGPAALPHLRVPSAVQQLRTVPRDFSEPAAADPNTCNDLLRVSSVDPTAGHDVGAPHGLPTRNPSPGELCLPLPFVLD